LGFAALRYRFSIFAFCALPFDFLLRLRRVDPKKTAFPFPEAL
jgi:hypothetical protein